MVFNVCNSYWSVQIFKQASIKLKYWGRKVVMNWSLICTFDVQEEPWRTHSCPAGVKPTSTWPSGGRWTDTKATTCSWWRPTRSDTRWGWSTRRCATLWCRHTTGNWAAAWFPAGTTSSPCSSCTVGTTRWYLWAHRCCLQKSKLKKTRHFKVGVSLDSGLICRTESL